LKILWIDIIVLDWIQFLVHFLEKSGAKIYKGFTRDLQVIYKRFLPYFFQRSKKSCPKGKKSIIDLQVIYKGFTKDFCPTFF